MVVIRPIIAGNGLAVPGPPSTARDDGIGAGIRSLGSAADNFVAVEAVKQRQVAAEKLRVVQFAAAQDFERLGIGFADTFRQLADGMDDTGSGFADAVGTEYDARYGEFLQSIPEFMRPEYGELIATQKARVVGQAAAAQGARREQHFVTGLDAALDQGATTVLSDPASYAEAVATYDRHVLASGLSNSTKDTLMTAGRRRLALAYVRSQLATDAAGLSILLDSDPEPGSPLAELTPEERFDLKGDADAQIELVRNRDAVAVNQTISSVPGVAREAARTGVIPDKELATRQQFVTALGEADGNAAFGAVHDELRVGKRAYQLRAYANPVLEDIVAGRAMQPREGKQPIYSSVSASPSAVDRRAAQLIVEERRAAPFATSDALDPRIGEAWTAAGSGTGTVSDALSVTMAQQQTMGIAEPVLVPENWVQGAVTAFNNPDLPDAERTAMASQLILATDDEVTRRAVVDQLVDAGLSPMSIAAFNVLARDTVAGRRMLKAAIVTAPTNSTVSDTQIGALIEQQWLSRNQVGELYYGLHGGEASNLSDVARDQPLMINAVRLAMSEGIPLPAAVDRVGRDMFGPVQALVTDHAEVLVEADADTGLLSRGFDGMLAEVRPHLQALLQGSGPAEPPPDQVALINSIRANGIESVLTEGRFRSVAGGYAFLDPDTGAVVPGPDGAPLIITREQVEQAGRAHRERALEIVLNRAHRPAGL